ncbi:MAG TPA: L,D-transpeptidase family protein [Solirubrobacteraceae bacterium]|jgi:peptidoglycan hydrolase-like protein with peptidoglycan-binding domain
MRARLHGGRAPHWRLFASGNHDRQDGPESAGRFALRSRWWLLATVAVAAVAVAAVVVAKHGSGSLLSSNASGTPAAQTTPLPPTAVQSLPKPQVDNGTEPLTVTLNAAPAPNTPRPRIAALAQGQPKVAGSWSDVGNAEVFKSASTLQPCESYRITVPQATHASEHSSLMRRRMEILKVSCPPLRGMQQALARLGYLPDSLRPAPGTAGFHGEMNRRTAAHLLYQPLKGTLQPDVADAPPLDYGSFDATTKGALVVFQEAHHLEADGEPGAATWTKLLTALAHKYRDPTPYTFVTVSEGDPETLEVHKGSKVVLTTPANTGVPGAETEQGIFPIYSRLTSTTMVGTDPDGTKYNVPDVPWVNYFNGGDAVHGYERASYGFPQSNGCVELPISTAETVFGMLALGDIVWVS